MWRFSWLCAAVVAVPLWEPSLATAQSQVHTPTLMIAPPHHSVVQPAAPARQQTQTWSYHYQYSWTNPGTTTYVPYPVYSGYASPYSYNYSPSLNAPSYPVNTYPSSIGSNYPAQGGASANPLAPRKGFRAPPLAKSKSHGTSAESRAKADKLIEQGDASFAKQQYAAAISRYKEAAQADAGMAEPYLRQGFALLAQKRYVPAAKIIRSGLEIRSDWTVSPWRLDTIYAEGHLAKTNQQLTKFVEANPLDPNLATALGVQLYFTERDRDRATTYFIRAQQLGANQDHVLDPFLPKPALADATTKPAEPAK